MEKEALIDIILNDLKEVNNLISTFKGNNKINNAFIKLTHTKIANITEELNLLEQLNNLMPDQKPAEQKVSEINHYTESLSTIQKNDLEAIADSSNSIISEEAEVTAPGKVFIDNKTAEPPLEKKVAEENKPLTAIIQEKTETG